MPRKSSTIPDEQTFVNLSVTKEPTEPKTIQELRTEAVNGVLQIAQFGCIAFGDFADAGAIGYHGPPLADEVVKLAENNAKVAAKVDLLIQFGPYAGIIAAGIPFLAQILVNHKIFRPESMANAGVVSPEVLESQMKTKMMEQAMDAYRKQREAEEKLMEMQEEMSASTNGDNPDRADGE